MNDTRRWRPAAPKVLVVGSSTGGPAALRELLAPLPETFPLPILIVQHMPADFTPLLAQSLDRHLRISVSEAVHGDKPRPGHALLAPGDRHMTYTSVDTVHLNDGPPVKSVRPSVDVLFSSVARVLGPAVLAVVLTGMGSDGCDGAKDIVDAGGAVLAQDEASSVVWGMPGCVCKAGLATSVAAPGQLGLEVVNRAGWQ